MNSKDFKTYFVRDLPPKSKYEIAFIGRSNVGKSSLLNSILNHKISRVSKTPGCTKWIGYYPCKDIVLIDLPGYGYAKISKERQGLISTMMKAYFDKHRADELFLLIDSRRGIMDIDKEIITFVKKYNVPIKIISTKIDKRDSKKTQSAFQISSKTKVGIDTIQEYFTSINEIPTDINEHSN